MGQQTQQTAPTSNFPPFLDGNFLQNRERSGSRRAAVSTTEANLFEVISQPKKTNNDENQGFFYPTIQEPVLSKEYRSEISVSPLLTVAVGGITGQRRSSTKQSIKNQNTLTPESLGIDKHFTIKGNTPNLNTQSMKSNSMLGDEQEDMQQSLKVSSTIKTSRSGSYRFQNQDTTRDPMMSDMKDTIRKSNAGQRFSIRQGSMHSEMISHLKRNDSLLQPMRMTDEIYQNNNLGGFISSSSSSSSSSGSSSSSFASDSESNQNSDNELNQSQDENSEEFKEEIANQRKKKRRDAQKLNLDKDNEDNDFVDPSKAGSVIKQNLKKMNEMELAKIIMKDAFLVTERKQKLGGEIKKMKTSKTIDGRQNFSGEIQGQDNESSFRTDMNAEELEKYGGNDAKNEKQNTLSPDGKDLNVDAQSEIYSKKVNRGNEVFQRQQAHIEIKKQKKEKSQKLKSKKTMAQKVGGFLKRGQTLFKGTFQKEDEEYDNILNQDKQRLRDIMTFEKLIILPDDPGKDRWDILIMMTLLFTSIQTPYRIAFFVYFFSSFIYIQEVDDMKWKVVDYIIDFIFFCDLIANFFSAYYIEYEDGSEELITNRKYIFLNYLRGWFFVDFFSIVPFQLFMQAQSFNKLFRLSKLPRLYRLVKMAKLARVLKVVKERNTLIRYLNEMLQLNAGFERLGFYILLFILCCHVSSCLWSIIANFEDYGPTCWMIRAGLADKPIGEIYLAGMYFTVMIVTTVGYGDINVHTPAEQIFCMFMLLVGVISFSFAVGSLTTVLQQLDKKDAKLKEKLQILADIQRDYKIPYDLFRRLRKSLKYDYSKNDQDQIKFLTRLPQTLRVELSLLMHQELIKNVKFFRKKDPHFIAFIGPLLKPLKVEKNQYVYKEGDPVDEIYFLVSGLCGYALPEYNNIPYVIIDKGYYFGEIDFIYINKDGTHDGKRKFSSMAIEDSDLLALNKEDLLVADSKFGDVFINDLFKNGYQRLKRTHKEKKKSIKYYKNCLQKYNRIRGSDGEEMRIIARLSKPQMTKSDLGHMASTVGKAINERWLNKPSSLQNIDDEKENSIETDPEAEEDNKEDDDELHEGDGFEINEKFENEQNSQYFNRRQQTMLQLDNNNIKDVEKEFSNRNKTQTLTENQVSTLIQEQNTFHVQNELNLNEVQRPGSSESSSSSSSSDQEESKEEQKLQNQLSAQLFQLPQGRRDSKTQRKSFLSQQKNISSHDNQLLQFDALKMDATTSKNSKQRKSIVDFEGQLQALGEVSETEQTKNKRKVMKAKRSSDSVSQLLSHTPRRSNQVINPYLDLNKQSDNQITNKMSSMLKLKLQNNKNNDSMFASDQDQEDNQGANRWNLVKQSLSKKINVGRVVNPVFQPHLHTSQQMSNSSASGAVAQPLQQQQQVSEIESKILYDQMKERMSKFEDSLEKINDLIELMQKQQQYSQQLMSNASQSNNGSGISPQFKEKKISPLQKGESLQSLNDEVLQQQQKQLESLIKHVMKVSGIAGDLMKSKKLQEQINKH